MILATTTTIQSLLSSGDKNFEIPRFQRTFVWKSDQALEMLQDLTESGGPVFLGTLVLQDKESEKVFLLVDGQQRLTTICVLLVAVRIRARQLKNSALANMIQSYLAFIEASTGESKGARLIVSEQVRDIFEKMVLDGKWNGNFRLPEFRNKKRQVNRLEPLFKIFWNHMKGLSQDDLSSFLKNIYGSIFVRIDIQDESEAFEIFERSNARGLDLNAAELLKNKLYANLPDQDAIEQKWATITEYASKSSLLRMLRYYYISNNGHIRSKELYKGLKQYSEDIGTEKLLDDLVEFSFTYFVFTNPTDDKLKELLIDTDNCDGFKDEYRLDSLRRHLEAFQLFNITQVYPVIIALYNSYRQNTDKGKGATKMFLKTMQALENFHFVNNMVSGHYGNEVEHDYATFAKEISDEDDFNQANKVIQEYTRKNREKKKTFSAQFEELSYANEKLSFFYYIFDRFSNIGKEGAQISDIYNPDPKLRKKNFNIEHLLPQSRRDGNNDEVIDNIGNLLAIPIHTNSSIGDREFSEKVLFLKKDSHIRVIKDFLENYGDQQNWGKHDIEKRAGSLAERAYDEVWGFGN